MLELNDILTPAPDRVTPINGIVRVIGISDDGKTAGLIRLDVRPINAPYLLPLKSIDPDNEENGILRLETFDSNLPLSIDELSPKKRKLLETVLEMMRGILDDATMVLDAAYRNREFDRIAKQFSKNSRTVQRHYYDYLWGGMIEMAFAGPNKENCAESRQQQPNTKKRGPKPKNPNAGNNGSAPLSQVREQLETGARLYFLSGKYTETEAFVLTKKKFFSNGKKANRTTGGKAELEDLLLPPKKLPSARQFHYIIKLLREREGDRETKPRTATPARTRSVRRGKANKGIHGPGYRYEIDATRVQIRIVSRYDPAQLVREATLYIIIDVWSGAIVGYALSLQPASWILAAKALYNCFTPKSKVFERLGLPYGEADWVSQHLPLNLTADRGELVSNKAGRVRGIGINVEITASMRPERKGSVEGKLEDVKHGDNFYLKPGKHKKNPQRREKDGKKEAALTLEELEQLVVEIILDLNNDPVPVENMPVHAVNAGISAITYGGLFAWGLKHRTGFTRKLPAQVVEHELMLRDKGSVTPEGIRFKKQNYTSEALLTSGLMAKAATRGNFSIDIRYDDLVGDRIRYRDPIKRAWTDVFNDNPDAHRLHASFWEIELHLFKAEALRAQAKENNISNKDEKAPRINKQARAAIKRAKAAKASGSRSNSKQAINQTTNIELAAERSKRLLAEQHSVAMALATKPASSALPREAAPPTVPTPIEPTRSVGQRTLELWKKKNAALGK